MAKLKKNVAISENGFIFNAARGDSFSTNEIGAKIMKALQNGQDERQIIAQLVETYNVDAATCEKDVYDFLKSLNHYSLLQQI
ncbi:MAG: PqqD family protein [Bacteroidia bacterium]